MAEDGVCPEPGFSLNFLWNHCPEHCSSDWDCPNYQKCCKGFVGCGTTCENPEPKTTCADVVRNSTPFLQGCAANATGKIGRMIVETKTAQYRT